MKLPPWLWFSSAIAVGIIVGLGALDLIRPLARPIGLFIISITIAAAISPIIHRLEPRMPRLIAIAIVYIALILILIGVVYAVLPLLVSQAKDLGTKAPDLLRQLYTWVNTFIPITANNLSTSLGGVGAMIVSLPLAIFNSLVDFVLIFFISLYWLILSPQLKKFLLSLFPTAHHPRAISVLDRIGQGMGGYLKASVINGFIIGTLTYIGLKIIGVNFAAILALVMGFFEIIPALGPVIGGSIIVFIAFGQEPRLALISLIFVIVLQQTEGHILVPNIMRTQTEISPLLVILALVGGAAVGGLLGALVAIPLVAALHVLIDEFVAPAVRRATGASEE